MNKEQEKSYYQGFAEDKLDLNQDLFDYLSKTFNITPLFDEISGLISIFEKHGWNKKVWQKEKPDYNCLFVARTSTKFGVSVWVCKIENNILYDNHGMPGSLEDLTADEYFVIERF